MVQHAEIRSLCEEIVRSFKPEKVILFGSYARGDPRPGSDVDLLVVMPFDGSPFRKAAEILLRVRRRFPLDLLLRTPEHVRQRLELNDPFIREILEKGRVLHDSAGQGVGPEG